MNITEKLRGALRRIAGVSMDSGRPEDKRRTIAVPSILNTYGPRSDVMPKPTPGNLRRFAETPVARRAINAIKDRIAGMRWRIQPKRGRALQAIPDGAERVAILGANLEAPNPDDSFRSLAEQVLEDVIVGGFGAVELQATGDPGRPLVLWPVDGATIRIKTDWDGLPGSPRYEAAGGWGTQANIVLNDDELMYIRLNARTHTPFGLGRLEVAFETVNAFLGAHRYASRLASNSVVEYALWLQGLTPEHHERVIRWWQDEIEGTGRVPILSVENKPEVLRFGGGTDADLRLQWQQFLLRVIADAFDLPPQYLGVERDVNRSTAGEMNDQAFRQAIFPTARLFAEHLTRDAIGKKLGWHDVEFVFTDVDASRGAAISQFRGPVDARVELDFREWGKLQMALAAGTEQINVLASVPNAQLQASGGTAATAVGVLGGSSASEVVCGVGAVDAFNAGDLICVDNDYEQQTGYVGTGIAAAYVKDPADVRRDADYIRRVTFNVGRVAEKTATSLLLAQPLPGGAPAAGMGVQKVIGFLDRDGGSFTQEWSALFVAETESGGRVCFYYPRLSPCMTSANGSVPETIVAVQPPIEAFGLHASFAALPHTDENDGNTAVCYRSYLPAALAAVY